MKWWYHWQTTEITGYFDKNSDGRWLICVNKSPVNPELLAGRKVTIKGEAKRLGRYLHNIGTVSYFDPWPDRASQDFFPAGRAAILLDRWKQAPTPRGEIEIRRELKTAGALARMRLGVTDWPIKIFERYALEPLENIMLLLNAKGLYSAPINELHESPIDGLKAVSEVLARLSAADDGRQAGVSTQNF